MEITSYKELLEDLNKGYIYGELVTSLKYSYFTKNIQKINDRGKDYIAWQHYGSSVNSFDEDGLKFIIETIFKETLHQFVHRHTRIHESQLGKLYQALDYEV